MTKTVEATMKAITIADLPANEVAFDKLVKSISTRGATLQRDMHIAGCFVLKHIEANSDVRIVQKLLGKMPESSRINAMRAWFEEYGPVKFDQNKPVFVKGKAVQMVKAMADPFWKFQPEPVYVAMNTVQALTALIKKLQTDEAKVGADHGALISTLETLKMHEIAPAIAIAAPAPTAAIN